MIYIFCLFNEFWMLYGCYKGVFEAVYRATYGDPKAIARLGAKLIHAYQTAMTGAAMAIKLVTIKNYKGQSAKEFSVDTANSISSFATDHEDVITEIQNSLGEYLDKCHSKVGDNLPGYLDSISTNITVNTEDNGLSALDAVISQLKSKYDWLYFGLVAGTFWLWLCLLLDMLLSMLLGIRCRF